MWVFSPITNLLHWWLKPHTEPEKHWYYLGSLGVRCFGNLRFHAYAAIVFGVVALWPAGTYVFGGKLDDPQKALWWLDFWRLNPFRWAELHPGQFVLWAFFITSSLPLFVWLEAAKFENWLAEVKPPHPAEERQWFEINARHVESFWKTIGSFFIGVGLLTLAKDRADASKRDTTAELKDAMHAETKKVTDHLSQIEAALAKLAATPKTTATTGDAGKDKVPSTARDVPIQATQPAPPAAVTKPPMPRP